MDALGTIEEIWRYPVSSLGGERLTSVELGADGIAGDRSWSVVDAATGQPAAPEKEERWRAAVFLQSRLTDNTPDIGFPDGTWLSVLDEGLCSKLSDHFGFDVAAWPYAKAGAELPDTRHVAVNRYEPSPLHLITTSALDHLSALVGTEKVQSKRFRPNIVLRTQGEADFREKAWLGKRLQLGSSVIHIGEETKRCGLTLIAQPDVSENPEILRSILRQNRRNFGVYASIETIGTISIGDRADLIDA